jgi:hypothetical protein
MRSCLKKHNNKPGAWLMPVILATQEAEIRRIAVRSQPRQIVLETLSGKITNTKQDRQSGPRAPA